MPIHVLILHATGTNRDQDAAQAFETVGAVPEIVHINQLRWNERRWSDFQILVLPGGFSYADALGAGRLLALDLKAYFAEQVRSFIGSGKPVIGICNGFQALVKAGLLPDPDSENDQSATLSYNAGGHFECRWVTLAPSSDICIWTRGLVDPITCPVAHGEGRFLVGEEKTINQLWVRGQVALVYTRPDGIEAQGEYPHNPNGSTADIAGICNPQGNVLGLMPHPENHIFSYQHPRWARGESGHLGLKLFENGVKYAEDL